MSSKLSPWFFRVNKIEEPRIRLFCYPYAGGSSHVYQKWHPKFKDDIELVVFDPPGRGARFSEPCIDDFDILLSKLNEHRSFITDVPFAFFGHSLGSKVLFMFADSIFSSTGRSPIQFFTSGAAPPNILSSNGISNNLSDEEFLQAVLKLNGTPAEVIENKELLELMLPVLRSDFKLADRVFHPLRQLPCPITCFTGLSDGSLAAHDVRKWRALTSFSYSQIELDGDHFFINHNSELIISAVEAQLDLSFNNSNQP